MARQIDDLSQGVRIVAVSKGLHKEHETERKDPSANDIRARIEAVAYQLWLERGAPIGSPDADWFEAENRLAGEARSKG